MSLIITSNDRPTTPLRKAVTGTSLGIIVTVLLSACVCRAQTAVAFKDRTAELGLTKFVGDPACWVDINNDGWVDLVCTTGIWKNNAGKSFTRIGDTGGSVVASDFDNDGFADLFSYGSLGLLHNDAGKGFTPVKLPELPKCSSRGACWGDFNSDGFIDLYIGGYEDWGAGITYHSMILMNSKGKEFKVAWSDQAYRTRGVTACDFDLDGDLDIYVSNYRLQPNNLWLNDGTATFKDGATEYNVLATSPGFGGGHSIGAAWGDFNNDGFMDLFAGNFAHDDSCGSQPKSRFLKNLGPTGKYHFEDKGDCGVFYQESYASPAAGDYDNDGNLDLMFTTVYGSASFGRPNNPVLFHNEGGFVFTDASVSAKVAGLTTTYQAAWADFNNDGNLDLVCDGKLFENQGATGNHWLEVRLKGDGRKVNRSAIGTQVRVKLKDKTLTRQVEAGTGEGNQNDLTLHFGLGKLTGSVTLEIVWPNGKIQTVRHVRIDRVVTVKY